MKDTIPPSVRKNKSRLITWLCKKIVDLLPEDYSEFKDYNISCYFDSFGSRFPIWIWYKKYEAITYEDSSGDLYATLNTVSSDEDELKIKGIDLYNREYIFEVTWNTSRSHGNTFKIDILGDVTHPDLGTTPGPGDEKHNYLYITFSELNDRLSTKFNLDNLLDMSDQELLDLCKVMESELLNYQKELVSQVYNQTIIPATKDWTKEYFENLKDHANDVEVFENLSLHELFEKAYYE